MTNRKIQENAASKEGIGLHNVVHCKREPFVIYIGRPGKWSNPFAIGRDETREQVIAK
ncbi:DUF4326 domain-containing protein [Tundrisphaera lichenicola]|uniref:DUF4326 domain-containing protein n=1 Tax=Tundrisphaera lichenicola TaxID=2029860 RepID=UPI003EBFA197